MFDFVKRIFGSAAPAADAVAKNLAREIVRVALAQSAESAKARARAKFGTNGTLVAVAESTIDELVREVEALIAK